MNRWIATLGGRIRMASASSTTPGRSVAGADDARLGKIDIILVSHMHGDHAGNAHIKAVNAGTCGAPDTSVSAMPNSNAANIAIAKKSKT
jgi:L-ascorbate metabolism protein UlaG (beta-lactamase superfamily)